MVVILAQEVSIVGCEGMCVVNGTTLLRVVVAVGGVLCRRLERLLMLVFPFDVECRDNVSRSEGRFGGMYGICSRPFEQR